MMLARRFVRRLGGERRSLWGVKQLEDGPHGRPRLRIQHPAGLAALVGYLKHQSRQGQHVSPILARGECEKHDSLVPALFREQPPDATKTLVLAEGLLEEKVRAQLGGMKRFKERHISAVLQHYGVRTSWVDLVDNLFIAVWFALNKPERRNTQYRYVPSRRETGWIHLLGTSVEGHPKLRVRDLRCEYFPLSLRPHAQHGWSATRWTRNDWSADSLDLGPYILASVEIPNTNAFWRLSGFMFEQTFLFPSREHDHTYGVLLNGRMGRVLGEVEEQCQLARGTLGRITRYVGAA